MRRASLVLLGLVVLIASTWGGCSQNSVTVPIRSLENSSRSAFWCLSNRNGTSPPGLPLESCRATSALPQSDFASAPHVISLVTQTRRGEVAVVDVTAAGVVDLDPSEPGFNFLPVGEVPTDVATTPGSTAAFVTVADPNRPGIFAISSSHVFPEQTGGTAPTLADLPACALPSPPSRITVIRDLSPAAAAGRLRCDPSSTSTAPTPGWSLADETRVYGPLKLAVTLPDLGRIVVVDAQALLSRAPGSFDACPVESEITLTVNPGADAESTDAGATGEGAGDAQQASADATLADAAASVADGGGSSDGATLTDSGAGVCSGRRVGSVARGDVPHPVDLAYADDGRLFVSDDRASVIHVVDARDPCNLIEAPPLLPSSMSDPTQAVFTGPLAVTPLTSDEERFLYAVDILGGGTVMVFDVSAGATVRTPLVRPDVLFNQSEPTDRLSFGSPVKSLTFGTREVPMGTTTGQVLRGLRCDPVASADPNNPSSAYAPSSDLTTGAAPRTLRGTFGFLVLANSQVVVVDLDDFDAACRRPKSSDDQRLGCNGAVVGSNAFPAATDEESCRIVERHRTRSNNFFINSDVAGRHAPAMQAFPLLRDASGTILSVDPTVAASQTHPKLLGPCLNVPMSPACQCAPGAQYTPTEQLLTGIAGVDTTPAQFCPVPFVPAVLGGAVAAQNWLAFDLVEPRAHSDQTWSVAFEGILSNWFNGRRGRLACASTSRDAVTCETGDGASHLELVDTSAAFCDHGAQGADLATAQHFGSGDIVQIEDTLPDPADQYWSTTKACSFNVCLAQYGTPDAPISVPAAQLASRGLDPNQTWLRRDLIVNKSFQDHLDLQASFAPPEAPLACCFPYPVTYLVRGGSQWIVTGSVAGFEHHIIPDPTAPDPSTAACISSCDPLVSLHNGRAARRPTASMVPPTFDDPTVFKNEAIRFVTWDPATFACNGPCLQRDMTFTINETGGFVPLRVNLSSSTLVLPQEVTFVPGLGQLAIVDATSQGLILFDLSRIAPTQSIF